MKKIKLWEAVPSPNARSSIGRIVVNKPNSGSNPRLAGEIYMCGCTRAFLNLPAFERHKQEGCQGGDFSINGNGTAFSDYSDTTSTLSSAFTDGNGTEPGHYSSDDEDDMFVPVPAKTPTTQVAQVTRKLAPNDARWVVSGRKQSLLKRKTSTSADDEQDSSSSSSGVSNSVVNNGQSESKPAPFNVMEYVSLDSSVTGELILRCNKCGVTAKETLIISEHIKRSHSDLIQPRQPPKEVKIESRNDHHLIPDANISNQKRNSTSKSNDGGPKMYTCDICGIYETPFSGNIFHHKKSAHAPTGFNCDFCNCVYETKPGLTVHIKRYHKPTSDDDNGENGNEALTRSQPLISALINPTVSIPRRFFCNLCNFSARSNFKLNRHKESSHCPDGKYPCILCPCVFANSVGLTAHNTQVHKKSMDQDKTKNVDQLKPRLEADGTYSCPISTCKYASVSSTGISIHLAKIHQVSKEKSAVPNSLNISIDASSKPDYLHKPINLKQIKKEPTDQPIDTSTDEKLTNSMPNSDKSDLDESEAEFNRPCVPLTYAHKCDICRTKFLHKHLLLAHNRSFHSIETKSAYKPMPKSELIKQTEKAAKTDNNQTNAEVNDATLKSNSASVPGVCDLCGAKVSSTDELNLHLKNAHVICGVECDCGCSFATATELTHHKNNECKKNLESLQIVNVVSMADSSPAPSICNSLEESRSSVSSNISTSNIGSSCACGQSFLTRSELVKHKAECPTVRTVPSTPSKVKSSSRQKLEEEGVEYNIKCSKCNKRFKTETGLQVHKNIVHEELVFRTRCDICGTRTPNYPVYKKHHQTCHVKNGIPCPECNCTFKSLKNLSCHFLPKHKKPLDPEALEIRCGTCDFVTYNPFEMDQHDKEGHKSGLIPEPSPQPIKEKVLHQCDLCSYESATLSTIKSHVETNHVENGYKCFSESCNNTFATKSGRNTHFTIRHPDESKPESSDYKCNLCPFTTGIKKNLDLHMEKNHVSDGFKCDYCSNTFATEQGLNSHIRMMHEKLTEKDYVRCKLCGYNTQNEKYYKTHMKNLHAENGYKCPNCPCSLRNFDGLSKHAAMMHKIKINKENYKLKCEQCDYKTLYRVNLGCHMKTAHGSATPSTRNQKVPCELCGDHIAESDAQHHLKRAHVEGGLPCPDCVCTFKTHAGLALHARLRHNKKLEFTKEYDTSIYVESCTKCGLRFKTKLGLYHHCRKMHGIIIQLPKTVKRPGERKRSCHLCNAEFTGSMSSHLKRYHVENGFKCAHCCCRFETDGNRSRHMIKAHRVFPTRRCSICGNKFLGTIKKHVMKCHVDDGVPCEFCPCTFESSQGRNQHEIKIHKHSREKATTTCEICEFKITETLQEHLKRCHVPDGFKCEFCTCAFETESGKLQHIKIRHRDTSNISKVCDICGFTLHGVSMKYHLEYNHVPDGIPCSESDCQCTFRTEKGKIKHLERCHNIVVETKVCQICGITLRSGVSMKYHLEISHAPDGLPCTQSDCNCTFKSYQTKVRHLARYHNIVVDTKVCELCGFTLASGVSMKYHLEFSHVPDGLPCSESNCTCTFRSEKSKIKHLARYHNIKVKAIPKYCKLCATTVSTSLAQHIKTHHAAENAYPCNFCASNFQSRMGRRIHLRMIHGQYDDPNPPDRTLPQKRYKTCTICGLQYVESLKQHMATSHLHTNAFKCHSCVCRFKTSYGLRRHVTHHHTVSTPTVPSLSMKLRTKPKTDLMQHRRLPNVNPEDKDDYLATALVPEVIIKEEKSPVKESENNTSSFSCSSCPRTFLNRMKLLMHISIAHSSGVLNKNTASSSTSMEESANEEQATSSTNNEDSNKPKQHTFASVAKSFLPRGNNYFYNKSKSQGPAPAQPKDNKLSCSSCGYRSATASHLNMHLHKAHVKNSEFPCPACTCAFRTEGELERHVKSAHNY